VTESGLEIVVEKGPSAGTRLTLTSGKATIGADASSTLALTGDEFVSSPHVTITIEKGEAILRNVSSNGTLVNGRPVPEARLAAGDRLSIGLSHLLTVKSVPRPSAPPPPPSAARPQAGRPAVAGASAPKSAASASPAAAAAPAPATAVTTGLRLPVWLMAYLGLMVVVFAFFAFRSLQSDAPPGIDTIVANETQYANDHKFSQDETTRVVNLLQTATVQERRGDARSAYEAYREVLGARKAVDPDDPAYRYAAARVGAIGPAR